MEPKQAHAKKGSNMLKLYAKANPIRPCSNSSSPPNVIPNDRPGYTNEPGPGKKCRQTGPRPKQTKSCPVHLLPRVLHERQPAEASPTPRPPADGTPAVVGPAEGHRRIWPGLTIRLTRPRLPCLPSALQRPIRRLRCARASQPEPAHLWLLFSRPPATT